MPSVYCYSEEHSQQSEYGQKRKEERGNNNVNVYTVRVSGDYNRKNIQHSITPVFTRLHMLDSGVRHAQRR